MSPVLGSTNASAALTDTTSPSVLVWSGVLVAIAGAWFVASMVKVWVAVPPMPSAAVTTIV